MSDALGLVGTTVLEKYAIEGVVGEGGFAIVYRATHLLWKRPVAIKVFSVLDSVPQELRGKLLDDFLQEGALLAQLSEQTTAIVQARDVGMLTTQSGMTVPYMVLEWLEGETLEDKLARERMQGQPPRSMEQAVALLTPVAEALAVAHTRGIVHRDVKPANIFLVGPVGNTDGTTIKLLDFGIAKVVQDAQKMAGSFNKTSGVVTSFTPAYGAPEQFSRTYGATGPWTDVFALALILGEMTSGKPPIDGDDVGQLAFASMNDKVRPSPRTLGATVSDAVENVMLGALAVKTTARPQTAREFWSQLTSVLGVADRKSGRSLPPTQDVAVASTILVPEAVQPLVDVAKTDANPTSHRIPVSKVTPTVTKKMSPLALVGLGATAVVAVVGLGIAALVHGSGESKSESAEKSNAKANKADTAAPSATASSAPAAIRAEDSGACPTGMVPIPGGNFFQGNDEGADDEKPAHKVSLSPYCIDKFEVTVAQYMQCSDTGACKRATPKNEWEGISQKERDVYDPLCNSSEPAARGNYPINCVSWESAATYCEANGKVLPSEAQWEFAARGPDGRKYPWGDEEPTGGHLNACGPECIAWVKEKGLNGPNDPKKAMYTLDDHFANTAPVGSFPAGASRFGVEDVVGNVGEWTDDWFAPYKKGKIGAAEKDPHNPEASPHKVVRGGAWNATDPTWLRPSFRYRAPPTLKSHGIGFRCAKTL
jgi:formylglycine-generating enzyme required for sulfatase activity/tRNA A-37 threonylcarbamoyl transferase component Bud32